MCGVIGVILADPDAPAAVDVLEALWSLQHRGQSSCGIATTDDASSPNVRRLVGKGLASEVFDEPDACLTQLTGHMGIGHLRYPTAGPEVNSAYQPLTSECSWPIAFAHNGNLVNTPAIIKHLRTTGCDGPLDGSDSQVFLETLARGSTRSHGDTASTFDLEITLLNTLKDVYDLCEGSFACAATIPGIGLLAFRDAYGLKPMVYGRRLNHDRQWDYMCASESVVLDKLGYRDITDVLPGRPNA